MTVADRIRVGYRLLISLVAAGFHGVAHHDVEVHLKARADQLDRWLLRCRRGAACGRPVNYRAGLERGHCARTRGQALQLAGDVHAHHPPERLPVRPTYAFSGRAYPRLPEVARVDEGVRYLVTLQDPRRPHRHGRPLPRGCPTTAATRPRPPSASPTGMRSWCASPPTRPATPTSSATAWRAARSTPNAGPTPA